MEGKVEEEEQITAEQRKRAKANRLAALAKRKAILSEHGKRNPWELFKCRKLSPESTSFTASKEPLIANAVRIVPKPEVPSGLPPEKFRARLEICSPDSFSITPLPVEGFTYPGEVVCFEKLEVYLSSVIPSYYTQNIGGGQACVYKLQDYELVLRALKNSKCVECEEIPWGTFNVLQRLSHSFIAGKWTPCRPEHLPDERVDELIAELPKSLLDVLFPFQLEGVHFALRRGGRCLIADELGLGKTLQAIAIAGCYRKEGPILIVCPAILRYPWAEELERWFPDILPSDIHLELVEAASKISSVVLNIYMSKSECKVPPINVRRLKEQVLLQLPPMRRRVIRLVLRKSDISSAKETLEMGNNKSSSRTDRKCEAIEYPDEFQDTDGKENSSKHVLDQALGIAKRPGFLEWLSMHPIIAELDGEEDLEIFPRPQKMIIFGHHHKVLDGVQEFLCEKGIQFVRIDSRIVGSDRQLAIQSFQSSREVKIALIGILAGGSGLNLTSAENVVFLELPKGPSELQQAESRAHRHDQTKPVNIYIYSVRRIPLMSCDGND